MKKPLQAILIAGYKMREDILYYRKNITVRDGHRDYTKGLVILGCPLLNWCVRRDITSVRHTTLGEVTEEEYKDDGFESLHDLKTTIQKHYPKIGLDSPVTVIRWE